MWASSRRRVFAELGHRVICVDNDEAKVRLLKEGGLPIHEEYLPEMLGRLRRESIEFTTDLHEATRQADAVFIAVGTPQSDNGDADLSYVDAVASAIARSIDSYKVIVEKSTVPVYTNEWITPHPRAQRRVTRYLRRRLQSRVSPRRHRQSPTSSIPTASSSESKASAPPISCAKSTSR